MNAETLIDSLHRRGVRLRIDGEVLRWFGPVGVMTETDLSTLRRHKAELSIPSLRELMGCHRTDCEHHALSDQQRLALAIVSGEIEAINAVLKAGRDAISRNAKAIEEVFVRVYEEWQHMRAAQIARGGEIGRQASWLFVDRKFGISRS